MRSLILRGAREHNLQDVDLTLPLGTWIAVTGPSGSGKTTLVFDTLVKEGQLRYLGALSARSRQYLGKLGRADAARIQGLPPAIAVGQRAVTAHARSTVGTLTGVLDLLRLLFARTATDPEGHPLSRSLFSFNHPDGACEACRGLGVEDLVDPELLVADPTKSIRNGALRPTLKNGYTVYSQVTLEVMNQICGAHGFDVDTPWQDLSDAQQHVVLYGTQALKVPFGKHSIASRMRWQGITARPREEGYYRGLIPVIQETLTRNRNDNVLRFVRSVPCNACGGSRLSRPGREAQLAGRTLPSLLALPVSSLLPTLDALPTTPVWEGIRPSLDGRLRRMVHLSLGHLSLARSSTTLSGGEAQRVRLAAWLTGGLGGLLVALDEPTLGLHPSGQQGMVEVLDELRALGNTLLVVEHDPDMVRHADRWVQLGPGAGPEGGRILFNGPLSPHPLGPPPQQKVKPRPSSGRLSLHGASLHNLDSAGLDVHLGAFNVVMGPSGAGKSSLVFGTLLPALQDRQGGPFTSMEGRPPGLTVRAVDAKPIGRTPRSTPATWTGLFDLVRRRFAATEAARERAFKAGTFSYNNKAGRCARCEGLGFERIGLHLLADVELACPVCEGGRYDPAVLEVKVRGLDIAAVLALSVREALPFFADDPPVAALCQAMLDLGLGYLRLGQSSTSLSRGEAQRVKLATLMGKGSSGPTLLILDEPDRGLHPDDVGRLLRCIDVLVDAGNTVLAISHHRHLWAAADYRWEVEAGRTRAGTPLAAGSMSSTRPTREPAPPPPQIALRGVRTHTLADLDLDLPHGKLSVIAGVSGSGKSSLAFDTLAAEAWFRFSESLPFQVRRFIRRAPRPPLTSAHGLGPTLALRQRTARAGRRSTVATQSELGPVLRLLFARAGMVDGEPCGLSAAQFSPDHTMGACPACEGMGTQLRCSPELLVSHPERSLLNGALGGTHPGRFFGEPDGQYLATLRAAGVDLDLPWQELAEPMRDLALYGAGDRKFSVSWSFQRGKRKGEHHFEGTWDGLCALVEREARIRAKRKSAAAWAEPLVQLPCPECGGQRLSADARAVRLGDWSLPALLDLPLEQVGAALEAIPLSARQQAVRTALLPELEGRLGDLCARGLGHLSLSRHSQTLSDGELQRTRLAGVLRSGLTGLTLVLDEPSAGLHARDLSRLLKRLERLRDAGNTLVVVAHRPTLIRAADHLVELGPGAGPEGGQIVAQGTPEEVLSGDSSTAVALRSHHSPRAGIRTTENLQIRGANAHNLRNLDLDLPAAGFVAVTGVSGSGKSSLVFDVIGASAQAGSPVGCVALHGLERFAEVRSARSAIQARSVVSATGVLGELQKVFHAASDGTVPKRAFSFSSPAGRCETCKGTGQERVSMDFLADLALDCPACEGRRYRPEVLAVRWQGKHIAEVLEQPVSALRVSLEPGPLQRGLDAMIRVGLGHLSLGRRTATLSGGEVQRLTLARSLVSGKRPTLFLLDEPATGLHERDLVQLVHVFQDLADRGDLVLAAAHRLSLIRAADHVVDLGPEGGPGGGRVVAQGPPGGLEHGATAAALSGSGGLGPK